MADFSVRSLASLEANASTARVLNLLSIWRRHREDPAHGESPFFTNELLNRAIIVKHRLRSNELDLMPAERTICTKVLMPIDVSDLRLGGVSIFVGERFWAEKLTAALGVGELCPADVTLLEELDAIPSLDPFITREQLKRKGYEPSALYFEINAVDLERMSAFVRKEVEPLVAMSLSGTSSKATSHAEKLVTKILSSRVDDEMEPLRLTLRLKPDEYSEGVFCWKGFLYYKWLLDGVLGKVGQVCVSLRTVKPIGQPDAAALASIEASRRKIAVALRESCASVKQALQVYDDAYASLVGNESPLAFRDFLLSAPRMFLDLGEKLGAMQHIVSFWAYRFPLDRPPKAPVEELLDILREFESTLS